MRGKVNPESLRVLVGLHNRYRFDPRGLAPREREALRDSALSWLERRENIPPV